MGTVFIKNRSLCLAGGSSFPFIYYLTVYSLFTFLKKRRREGPSTVLILRVERTSQREPISLKYSGYSYQDEKSLIKAISTMVRALHYFTPAYQILERKNACTENKLRVRRF